MADSNFTIDLTKIPLNELSLSRFEQWYPFLELKGLQPLSASEPPWMIANGLFLSADKGELVIHTDNFGTIPLFFNLEKKCLASDLRQFDPFGLSVDDLDLAGFWEGMTFDSSLNMRTLNKNIIQIPGGSCFRYSFLSGDWSITRWNHFKATPSNLPDDELLQVIDARLQTICRAIWDQLLDDGYILLPLSGGLDSRLLALHLATTGDPSRIKVVTYGFSKRSHEYRMAHTICEELKIPNHSFYHLPRDHYKRWENDFWNFWQGCVAPVHAHFYSFLHDHIPSKAIMVSGFLGDHVGGWATEPHPSAPFPVESTMAYKQLLSTISDMKLERKIAETMIEDLRMIFQEWQQADTSLGFNAYLYFVIRSSKLFCPLLNLYRQFCKVAIPYGDPQLVNLFLSAPIALKRKKMILRKLVALRNKNLFNLSFVSASYPPDTLYCRIVHEWRTFCSRLMLLGMWATDDRFRWVSTYATEDVIGAMRRECRPEILTVLKALNSWGVLSQYQYDVLRQKPLRAPEVVRATRIFTCYPWVKSKLTNS